MSHHDRPAEDCGDHHFRRAQCAVIRLPLRLALGAAVALTGLCFGCGGDSGSGKEQLEGPGFPVHVMTRNLYLGTDLIDLVGITTPEGIPDAMATLWDNVQASDVPGRMKVVADEIIHIGPDLVALQEVSIFQRETTFGNQAGDSTPNATEVVYDFLSLLMAELEAQGGGYRVAGDAPNGEAALPVSGGAGASFELRVTDRDVILARDTVQTSNFVSVPYSTTLKFTVGGTGGIPVEFARSASRLDAVVGDAQFTFANTHLEIEMVPTIQLSQAEQLLDVFAGVPGPVLLLGDFNSAPGTNSYQRIVSKFVDVYPAMAGGAPGSTCCQTADLRNAESTAAERIDLVLTRGRFRADNVSIVGTDPVTARTPKGLWPSDHFGVAATVELVP